MTPSERPPVIGIPACLVARDGFGFHQVGGKYVDSVIDGAGGLPLLIPALGSRLDPDALLDGLDGLLISGSPSNVEPHHYGGPPPPAGSASDPARDATTLPLIRRAIARAVPLFAICRGVQELNVALGGSLHQEVHGLTGRLDHRSDKTLAPQERYGPAHEVILTPGGRLQELLGGAGRDSGQLAARPGDRPAGAAARGRGERARWHDRGGPRGRCALASCSGSSGTPNGGCSSIRSPGACSRPSAPPAARAPRRDCQHERHGALASGA